MNDPVLVGGMIYVGILVFGCFWLKLREGR